MRKLHFFLSLALVAVIAFGMVGVSRAQQNVELRMIWYNDGNEGDVVRDLLDRFEKDNPSIKVTMETVPFADLPTLLNNYLSKPETTPDIIRFNDVPRYAGQYLDMTPYLTDAKAYEAAFPVDVLNTARVPGGEDKGLYSFPNQFTITGPFINATLFEQAGVTIPEGNVTFAEWVKLSREVAEKTNTPYAVSIDRSLHRIFGPSLSLGATWVNKETGRVTIDTPGLRTFVDQLVSWHTDNITPKNVWVAEGDKYASGRDFFVNGQLVFYFSGSWQVQAFDKDIADKFDWRAVPQPCGSNAADAICSGMPGGTSVMAMKATKYPAEVTKVLEYLSSKEVLKEFSARTLFLPGRLDVIAEGVDFQTSDTGKVALSIFTAQIPKLVEQAYLFQLSALSGPLNNELRTRIAQAIVGEITVDDAIKAVQKLADETCDKEPNKCLPIK